MHVMEKAVYAANLFGTVSSVSTKGAVRSTSSLSEINSSVAMLQRHLHRPTTTGHSGRVSGITLAASAGVSMHDLSLQTGHKDLNTLSAYIEVCLYRLFPNFRNTKFSCLCNYCLAVSKLFYQNFRTQRNLKVLLVLVFLVP